MGKGTPLEITKIKKIVADIREFPAKIDSAELAKNARHLLKKYALLSEKIERNVLTLASHQKDLAKIRTEEFKTIRQKLKEKANLILHAKDGKAVKSEKPAKKTVKTSATKKTSKAVDAVVVKQKAPKKTPTKAVEKAPKKAVEKASPKPRKAATPKDDA